MSNNLMYAYYLKSLSASHLSTRGRLNAEYLKTSLQSQLKLSRSNWQKSAHRKIPRHNFEYNSTGLDGNFEMGFRPKASQHKVRFGVEAPAPSYILGQGEGRGPSQPLRCQFIKTALPYQSKSSRLRLVSRRGNTLHLSLPPRQELCFVGGWSGGLQIRRK